MKHVFVETNFLVDLLRPRSKRSATELFARHGSDVALYIPWCSVADATLGPDDESGEPEENAAAGNSAG